MFGFGAFAVFLDLNFDYSSMDSQTDSVGKCTKVDSPSRTEDIDDKKSSLASNIHGRFPAWLDEIVDQQNRRK